MCIKRRRNLQTEAQHGLEVVVADALMVRLDRRIIDKTLGKVAGAVSATFPRVFQLCDDLGAPSTRSLRRRLGAPRWRSPFFLRKKKKSVPQVPGT
eukprot:SAG11_NODE_10966_length_792_cov_111.792208_1_plen_96_part_00